jgi:hypothetical protein
MKYHIVLHHVVPRLGIDVFALSALGVTTDKNSALQGTFSAATKTVQVSVRTGISKIPPWRGNDM